MARLGIQKEEKNIFLKYIGGLSPYIHQEMDFMTVSMIVYAFHYANKIESKQKGKAHLVNKPIGRTSNRKSSVDSNK